MRTPTGIAVGVLVICGVFVLGGLSLLYFPGQASAGQHTVIEGGKGEWRFKVDTGATGIVMALAGLPGIILLLLRTTIKEGAAGSRAATDYKVKVSESDAISLPEPSSKRVPILLWHLYYRRHGAIRQ